MNKIVKYPELKPEFQEAGHDLPKLDAIIRRVAGARHELKEQGREIIEYTQRFEGMNGEGFRLLGQWARIDEELRRINARLLTIGAEILGESSRLDPACEATRKTIEKVCGPEPLPGDEWKKGADEH